MVGEGRVVVGTVRCCAYGTVRYGTVQRAAVPSHLVNPDSMALTHEPCSAINRPLFASA